MSSDKIDADSGLTLNPPGNNGVNSAYYNDNDPGDLTPTPYPFEYDGFTNVFGVTIDGLTAGNTYNIALNFLFV